MARKAVKVKKVGIILREQMGRERIGSILPVNRGYARYLVKAGRAAWATEAAKAEIEKAREQLEAENRAKFEAAKEIFAQVNGMAIEIKMNAGAEGRLFGSVKTADIADKVRARGFELYKEQVIIHEPIKSLGAYQIDVMLHPEVRAVLDLHVTRDN